MPFSPPESYQGRNMHGLAGLQVIPNEFIFIPKVNFGIMPMPANKLDNETQLKLDYIVCAIGITNLLRVT